MNQGETTEEEVQEAEVLINQKYKLGRQIGYGSFGKIHEAKNIDNEEQVAVKMESVHARHPQLEYESKIYKLLDGGAGIPSVRWFGIGGSANQYNCLVMDLLGPSLEDLFSFCSRKFTLKTVLLLADQMICRLEYVHSRNHVHRDVKPDNFLMGTKSMCNKVYLVDYGLAKKYTDSNQRHVQFTQDHSLTGTARYASVNMHRGFEQSRRDDLESLGYVLLYFLRPNLPWQGLQANNRKQKYHKIYEVKCRMPVSELTKNQPPQFRHYVEYCRSLDFDEAPDYHDLRERFTMLFHELEYTYDYVYDWTLLRSSFLEPKKSSKKRQRARW